MTTSPHHAAEPLSTAEQLELDEFMGTLCSLADFIQCIHERGHQADFTDEPASEPCDSAWDAADYIMYLVMGEDAYNRADDLRERWQPVAARLLN